MANFNKVILMGNLTRDVELKSIGSGQSVGKIGLAVNRNFTTASGEKRTETTYVDCEAWGKQAEIMAKYLSKGKPVMIEGRLKYEQWEDKEGKKRSTLKVVVENFQFVGAPGGGGGGGGGDGGGGSQGNWSRGQGGESREPIHEPEHAGGSPDDIPF
ncbi:MAG: single-stranded DNA-binding protein [Phycisphaerae bacterium]|jgi:single-strand DNA-binding protein